MYYAEDQDPLDINVAPIYEQEDYDLFRSLSNIVTSKIESYEDIEVISEDAIKKNLVEIIDLLNNLESEFPKVYALESLGINPNMEFSELYDLIFLTKNNFSKDSALNDLYRLSKSGNTKLLISNLLSEKIDNNPITFFMLFLFSKKELLHYREDFVELLKKGYSNKNSLIYACNRVAGIIGAIEVIPLMEESLSYLSDNTLKNETKKLIVELKKINKRDLDR